MELAAHEEPGEEREVTEVREVHVESDVAPVYRVAMLAGHASGVDEPRGQ